MYRHVTVAQAAFLFILHSHLHLALSLSRSHSLSVFLSHFARHSFSLRLMCVLCSALELWFPLRESSCRFDSKPFIIYSTVSVYAWKDQFFFALQWWLCTRIIILWVHRAMQVSSTPKMAKVWLWWDNRKQWNIVSNSIIALKVFKSKSSSLLHIGSSLLDALMLLTKT